MANLARTIQSRSITSRLPFLQVALALLQAATLAAITAHSVSAQSIPSPNTLLRYSFDDNLTDTGPDTFSVFQSGQGTVSLTSAQRFSGYRSVELRDIPGDKNFPELQGYFPLREKGKLYLHFALMTTDPRQELNIALAGPQWFRLCKDGISLWLKTVDGNLVAISDSMPKKLFRMQAFVWYVVDIAYDIDAGTYDLTVHQDTGNQNTAPLPVAQLRAQPNAPMQPGSRIDKFSFIGDHETDASSVVYYVDDVLLGVDESIVQQPFVAPGRRKLFVDYWNQRKLAKASRPAPVPLLGLSDLGINAPESALLRKEGASHLLPEILSGNFTAGTVTAVPDGVAPGSAALLDAILAWQQGRKALQSGKAQLALTHFSEATRLSPAAPIFQLDALLALVQLQQWDAVDQKLPALASTWRDDPRFPATLATIGFARGNFDAVEKQLRQGAESTGVLAEQYFLALLWKGDSARATAFAQSMQRRGDKAAQAKWTERLGDAAILSGDIPLAKQFYQASLPSHPRPASVWSKLSDVHHKLGDPQNERLYRERLFGSLNPHP